MEKTFYNDDFEQLLKEKADQFRMYPSRRVWHSIYNNLHPSRRWPSAAMSLLLIITLHLTGYLNTNDTNINNQFIGNANTVNNISNLSTAQKRVFTNTKQQSPNTGSGYVAKKHTTSESEISPNTDVNTVNQGTLAQNNAETEKYAQENKVSATPDKSIVQAIDSYIKMNQVFADVADANKKVKIKASSPSINNTAEEEITGESENEKNKVGRGTDVRTTKNEFNPLVNSSGANKLAPGDKTPVTKNDITSNDKSVATEDKAWIEDFAFHNKPQGKKWKGKLDLEFYATPAVNYRKLTTASKGSTAPFATTGDINQFISQKPGLGIESGIDLSYAFAKNLRLKTGIQFNYTNYNINADQTNHPVLTTVLLNDPTTGYSYLASRTSTISNSYNSSALQPVVLHNRTYQISIPVGLAYKLSSTKNVDWFAGASVEPTYVFGGKAHLISADLKSYVYEPSSIRNWNLGFGFETYMSYKLGAYNLQVGPRVRFQAYSTYQRNVALIEKPYAVGLKVGIVKGF